MNTKLPLIVFLLIAISNRAYNQEYSYANYDVKDGLAGSVVYCGVEDKEGFLWFGTDAGLSRFDGTHFKTFTTSDGLPDNEILRLFVDSKNRVWIIPYKNAICYYWKGKIYNPGNDTVLAKLVIQEAPLNVVEDREGNIMVVTPMDVNIITRQQQIVSIPYANRSIGANVHGGINYLGKFVILSDDSIKKGINIKTIENLHLLTTTTIFLPDIHAHPGNIQVTPFAAEINQNDSLRFSVAGGKYSAAYKYPSNLNSCSVYSDSLCAINTADGTTIFNYREQKVVRTCLTDYNVNNIVLDSEGCYWFLTAGKGIIRISSFEFTSFSFDQNHLADVLPVFCLAKIAGQVYAGSSQSQYFKIDPVTMAVTTCRLPVGDVRTRIVCFQEIPGYSIVFGTDAGIFSMGKSGNKSLFNEFAVKAMDLYKDSLFIASNAVTFFVSKDLVYKLKKHVGRSTAVQVYENKFYFGTLDGLCILKSDLEAEFLGDKFPSLQNRVSSLASTTGGPMWIATYGQGVIGYKKGQITHVITTKEGLNSNICRSIYVSGTDVWVGTDKGLNRLRFTGENYQVVSFSRDDGLIADEVNAVLADGALVYAGTPAGLTCFDPDKISQNSYCKLRLTNFEAGNIHKTYDSAGFSFPHDQNEIRVDFVGISYRSAGNINYRYRLVGLNDNWQTTRETFLRYPTLPSGDYQLEIIATNKFGVESDMIRIPFVIEKLLWEKIWFRLLMMAGIGGLIWLFVHNRIRKVKKQDAEKMQISYRIAELEQMALKAQMNPHFIFNSLNSLQHYVIEKDVLGANKFITDFSRLIRLTLELSTKTNITIYEEISYLTTYLELEKTKFEDKFTYTVNAEPELDSVEWQIPPMILQPYVENSIRHGVRNRKDKLGRIIVSFLQDEDCLICVVEDNGVGREIARQFKSQMPIEYQSKGMTLTAKRIEMLNRDRSAPVLIAIEDLYYENKPAGTKVTVRFPLGEVGR